MLKVRSLHKLIPYFILSQFINYTGEGGRMGGGGGGGGMDEPLSFKTVL